LKSFGDDPWGVAGRNLLNLHLKPGPIFSWVPPKDHKQALEQFKRDLIAKQVEDRKAKHRTPLLMLPDTELASIDMHNHKLRKDIAPRFLKMWDELVAAHRARPDKAPGDAVGVASAYRDATTDRIAWENAFRSTYYPQTLQARLKTGDEFGLKALDIIFAFMNKRKAPPGYSGHTHGIATDLMTTQSGQSHGASAGRDSQLAWQKTWLYDWLVGHAWRHNFYQLKMETFHWEYHSDGAGKDCYAGDLPRNRRDVLVKDRK
jgi:hypothetical protein